MDSKNIENTPAKKENNGTTEVVFVLDRSGSMSGLEKDTIGGFNSMIEKQKNEGLDAVVTTVIFDTIIDIIHDRIKLGSVPELTEKEYFARGSTALLDAVGSTIQRISKLQDKGIRPRNTLFVITTDGYENASKKFTYKSVEKLIEAKKECGWEFIFLGANIDAAEEASKMGIEREYAVDYCCDGEGIERNFEALECAIRYSCCVEDRLDGSWREDIDADYAKRGKRKN